MHSYELILTLAGGLSAALCLGYLTQRAGLSPIVGYLLAGTLVGPYTPGFVADVSLAEQLAEIGVVLLMFGVGLTFHIDDLLAVRRVAVPGAIGQSVVATVAGAFLAHWLGWDWPAAIVFGMALAVASTVVLVRVLSDHNDLHSPAGRIAVGWLVVEDLLTVIALVLLPAILTPESSEQSIWWILGGVALKVGALVAFTVLVGARLIPAALNHAAKTRSRELFTLTVLVVALGISVGASLVFGVSMALGAFLAGMVVGRSDFSMRAASEALPMRDAFAVLFFVSIGMLLDPVGLVRSPWFAVSALAVILIVKPLAALVIVALLKYPARVSLTVAISLAQIGEFSFILATLGREMRLLTAEASNALVAASIVSIVLNPLLYRAIRPLERWLSRRPRHHARTAKSPDDGLGHGPADERHRAVVIGYGPTGRTVVRLLIENAIVPTVVDLNVDAVRTLREQGVRAVHGDAVRAETLEEAGVARAATLILSSAGLEYSAEVIRTARRLNPDVLVLARAAYLRDLPGLRKAGADTIYSGEGEVALAFVENIMRDLGATPDQIDRERERAHSELAALGSSGS